MTYDTCRSDYLALAGAKLIEIQAKVYIVKAVLRNEIAKRDGCESEQFRRSKRQVEHFMTTAQQKLEDLRNTEDEDWETARDSFNTAWEDVAQSIRTAVAKFS
jgi:hypothetical protein